MYLGGFLHYQTIKPCFDLVWCAWGILTDAFKKINTLLGEGGFLAWLGNIKGFILFWLR